ncbi:lasso RiPP family leader peptide-containing protein [Mesorhizobium waimense]|uniref:Lasso RiPP family leader peptide-containing protein n=1 Tax=Mesorhizobium waimense TaxID=1300307 RepID=A0A3A5KYH2_9HYPH|nr:lasso RiPP family leader peptide-containing protein [Mesorhizobium waimense]RJT36386.1 lasso RiPP family leader peptide-containing protein [Mesorhizobium waimense]
MKKTYEKPVLVKKGRLSAVTAANGASGPTGPAG